MRPNKFNLPSRWSDLAGNLDPNASSSSQVKETVKTPSAASEGDQIALTDLSLSAVKCVLILNEDAPAASRLAADIRSTQPTIVTMCAHTAHAALLFAAEYRPDAVIVDLGARGMSGTVIAGAIFVACPGARPMMIALSGGESRIGKSKVRKIFDHMLAKPVKVASLVSLIAKRPVLAQHG